MPLFVEQNMALIQKGIDQGISQPKVIFKGYENTYEQHITTTAEDNFYFSPFLNLPQQWSKEVRDSLFNEAKAIVKNDVVPSFQKIKGFFEENYLPNTREEIGVSSTPNGTAYYNNRIAYYTTLSLNAQEIHQTGLEEVEKIRAAMKAIIAEVGFNGSFADFFTYLRTNPRFYAKTPDELLMRARDISKRLDEQLPRFLKPLPANPMGWQLSLMQLHQNTRVGAIFLPVQSVMIQAIIGSTPMIYPAGHFTFYRLFLRMKQCLAIIYKWP